MPSLTHLPWCHVACPLSPTSLGDTWKVVNAHLKGRKLTQYQVVGELRAVPVAVPSPPSEFRFRLKNTHRIEQVRSPAISRHLSI